MLVIHSLGTPSILLDGEPLTGLASRKAQALLIYLAYTRHSHPRESLATLLWTERNQEQAMTNLKVVLSSLRKSLSGYVTIDRYTVAFNTEADSWLDASVFEEAITKAQHSLQSTPSKQLRRRLAVQFERALSLYQDDFLAAYHLKDAYGFEEWLLSEREHLRWLASEAMLELSQFYFERGLYQQGTELAQRLIAMDPLREQFYRQVMRLLAAQGKRSAALAQYQQCQRLLAEEMDITASQETQRLARDIERGHFQTPKHLPNRPLPPATSPLVGRERELELLTQWLDDPYGRLISIVGMGGVGKTRLALELTRRQQGSFLDGVFIVSLAAANTREALLSSIAATIGLDIKGQHNPEQQLLNALKDKEMLLVLDNVEQLIEACSALIVKLLPYPDLCLLLTSRERLHHQHERVLELKGLAHPKPDEDPEPFEAAQLFLRLARYINTELRVEGYNSTALAKICYLLRGLPLALELAAAWIWRMTLVEIATTLEESLIPLATSAPDVPTRHRSMQLVFDYSYQQLNPEDQAALVKLALFQGGFSHDAAKAVATASREQLAALRDKSLLVAVDDARYDWHPLIQDFARHKLAEDTALEARTRQAHATFFASFVTEVSAKLISHEQLHWLSVLDRDYDNIRAVLAYVLDEQALELGFDLAGHLNEYWKIRDSFNEAQSWLEQLLAVPAGKAMTTRSKALNTAGTLATRRGHHDAAKAHFEESLAIHQTGGNRKGIAAQYVNLGLEAYYEADYRAAHNYFKQSLALYEALGAQRGKSNALHNHALVYKQEGNFAEAHALMAAALTIDREVGSPRDIALALNNLGNLALNQADYPLALGYLEESLELRRELGEAWGLASTLNNIGNVLLELGDYTKAQQHYQESLRWCLESKDSTRIIWNLEAYGASLVRQQLAAHALPLWAVAERLRAETHYPMPPNTQKLYQQDLERARAQLNPERFNRLWREGQQLSVDEVVDYALTLAVL